MLKPFQLKEKEKMRMLESVDPDDMTFQTTFGWLGSCRGMGGKMVTMASYLNERVSPLRVEDRAWTNLRSSVLPGAPSAVLQTNRVNPFNPHDFPDVSFDVHGNERQTTLIVVSSETSFEMDRWRTAMDEHTTCRTACFKTLIDIKKIFPARDRPSLNADSITSERLVLEFVRANIEVVIVSISCLDRYKKLFGEIAWTRIVLNDGLTDHTIWRVFQNVSHEHFPSRFLWLIEALSDNQFEDRMGDVHRLAGLTHGQRFTRRNWLESLCAANVLQSLVVRTDDLTIQASANIVKHLDMRVFTGCGDPNELQTKEYKEFVDEQRIMNASFWMQLSDTSVRLLSESGRHLQILRKAGGLNFVREESSVESEECPVCLNTSGSLLSPCGHGMCPGCCAGLYMRSLDRGVRCPLCRTDATHLRVEQSVAEAEKEAHFDRVERITTSNQAHLARIANAHDSLAFNVRTCIEGILAENSTNQVLMLCVPMQYQQILETSIPHTPLHLTLHAPPSVQERVYYANSRLFVWSMFRRVPYELKEVTHILVVRDRTRNPQNDLSLDLIDMLRVWSLGRTTHNLHYIFFDPESTT